MLGQRTAADVAESLHMALKDAHPFVQRAACEALIRAGIEPSLDELRPLLGNPDRFLRFAARSVLERIDSKKWAGRLGDPEKLGLHAGLDMIVALCRTNHAAEHAEAIFEFLKQHDQPSADADMLDVVRTMELALCHTTERPDSVKAIGKAWVPMFPHPDWRISRELAVTLADLEKERQVDDFHERLLGEMLKEKTDREQQIHYFYCLRVAQRGWNEKDKASARRLVRQRRSPGPAATASAASCRTSSRTCFPFSTPPIARRSSPRRASMKGPRSSCSSPRPRT